MKKQDFTSDRFGHLTTRPLSSWPHEYFLPQLIPRELSLSPATVAALSRADLALGRLSGLALLVNDPALLLGPAMAQEALASSKIEGTQASLSDVLSVENEGIEVEDLGLREVTNYLDAASEGMELLKTLPLTQRLIRKVHATLLADVRGEGKYPGELRRSPVWIGSPNARPETARFIPPHHDHLGELLADWERFVNESPAMPPVQRCALAHYQFETIHPFLDGNGRMGRLLIGFQMVNDGVLPAPILHISGYFERHREEYYERLQRVRERGEIEPWIQFFSQGVEEQSVIGAKRITGLVEIRERYRRETRTDRTVLPAVIDIIFRNPVITVATVVRETGVSQPTASAALHKAEDSGWLRSAGRFGRGGRERWVATEIWAAVAGPVEFGEDD